MREKERERQREKESEREANSRDIAVTIMFRGLVIIMAWCRSGGGGGEVFVARAMNSDRTLRCIV